jgi:hypothetical protein
MSEPVHSATDEVGAVPTITQETASKEEPRGFLRSGRKNLTEEDLSTAAARRFLIAEIERLDQSCSDLRGIERKYNDLRVEHATLKEATKASLWFEILSYFCFSIGTAGVGTAPSYFAITNGNGIAWTVLIGSGVLMIVGLAARVFK